MSELVWLHNDTGVAAQAPIQIGSSLATRLRAYWRNNVNADWVHEGLDAKLLGDEVAEAQIASLSPVSAQLFQRDIVEVGNGLGGGALAAVLAGARSYTGVEMSSVADLAMKLTETYPNIAVTEDIETVIDQVKNADVLIVSAEPETNSPLAQAVAARAKVTKDRMAVIRL